MWCLGGWRHRVGVAVGLARLTREYVSMLGLEDMCYAKVPDDVCSLS